MTNIRCLLFALLLFTLLLMVHGAKRGNEVCKNCIKNQVGHQNQRLIASPINLLNPDRYEFFTLDERGKVVKRIMTFKEIQSIVAGSDISETKLFAHTNNNDRIVSSVVSNVRNVLNNELNLMQSQDSADHSAAELPISEMIHVEDESAASSAEYTHDKSSEESAEVSIENILPVRTTERTTPKPTEKITERPTVQWTESTTKRWTTTTTERATESTTKAETERTTERTTIRPTISSTERAPVRSTFRPTESSTVRTTTALPKVQSTAKPTERSTTVEPQVRSSPVPTTRKTTEQPTERSTVRSTMRTTTSTTERPTERTTQSTTMETVKLSTEGRTTTTPRPTEKPSLKLADRSTTTTDKPTVELKNAETSTTTVRTVTERVVVKTTETPPASPVRPSTEKSSEQSGDYSTLRSEEAFSESSLEYSTEESSEKVYEQSSETKVYTAEKSSTGSTAGLKTSAPTTEHLTKAVTTSTTVKPTESHAVSTTTSTTTTAKPSVSTTTPVVPTKYKIVSPVTTSTTVKPTESHEVSTTTSTTTTPKPSVSTTTPVVPTKYKIVSSTTNVPVTEHLESSEVLQDLVENGSDSSENDSSEEILTTPGFSSLLNDVVAHYVTMGNRVPAIGGHDENIITNAKTTTLLALPEVTTVEANALDETLPTTTSVETLDGTTLEDSAGYGSEESEELKQTTIVFADRETTATVADVTYKPSQTDADSSIGTTVQDSSTIPSDAQHAIHKIIESLQSINEDSVSDDSDEEMLEEGSYTMDVPGMSYDVDAQSSINAIIQSLGQGSLVSGENVIISTTTDIVATTEVVPTTTTRAPVQTTATPPTTNTTTIRTSPTIASTTSMLKVQTSAPVAADENEASSSGFLNYNTNIIDTIEKFLSKFAGQPNEETYALNHSNINILSDYPSDTNMTDYVDRTATVASVLKFPQTRPVEPERRPTDSEIEVKHREDPPQSLSAQSLLNETVASFMKLGEMLTMGNRVNTAEPSEGAQLELKTAVDEEETEFLRFLSICGNLGTNVYDFLTGPALEKTLEGRSLVYSPFATVTTLSMLFLGTRGTTAESINGVMGLDEMTSFNPHLFFKSIADDLKPKQRRTAVSAIEGGSDERGSFFSRTLLSDESRGGLQRFFKARIQEIYSAVAEPVDFRQKDTLLMHMSGDFPRDYVDTLKQLRSPLVSISRNRYHHECNDATTYGIMNFKQSTGGLDNTVAMPSVTFRTGFSTGFSKALDATILSLPGSSANVSVFFLKPSTPAGLPDLETHIRTQSLSTVLKLFPDETLRTAYAEVQLPHFTQTTIYNMSRSIQQLGLQILFEPNAANFNGLQDSTVSNLFLSETIQTDSFALCGGGDGIGRTLPFRSFSSNLVKPLSSHQQSGSIISEGKMGRRNRRKLLLHRDRSVSGAPQAQDSKLTFDTPFLYLVRHNPTGLVLYMGRFVGNRGDK